MFLLLLVLHRAFVAPPEIQAFTSEAKTKLAARCQGKTVKYFAQAVKEICEAFEKLQHNNLGGLTSDPDKEGGLTDDPDKCSGLMIEGTSRNPVEDDPKNGVIGEKKEDNAVCSEEPDVDSLAKGLIPTLMEYLSDVEEEYFSEKGSSPSQEVAVANGKESKEVKVTNSKGGAEVPGSGSSVATASKYECSQSEKPLRDGKESKIGIAGGSMPMKKSFSSTKKAKNLTKPKKHPEEKLSGRKRNHNPATGEVSRPSKKTKSIEVVDNAIKKPAPPNTRNKEDKDLEVKKSSSVDKAEKKLAPATENVPGDKMEKNFVGLKSDNNLIGSPAVPLHIKRRAVCRFNDDDGDAPKTPVHGGSASMVKTPSSHATKNAESSSFAQHSVRNSNSNGPKSSPFKERVPSAKLLNGSLSPSLQAVDKRPKKIVAVHVSHSPGKLESEKSLPLKEAKPILLSPESVVEQQKVTKPINKVSSVASVEKTQVFSGRGADPDGFNGTQTQPVQRNRHTPAERPKTTPKPNSRLHDSALLAENPMENNSVCGEKYDCLSALSALAH